MNLKEWQQAFATSILTRDDAVMLNVIETKNPEEAKHRLSIYRDAYYLRLKEVIYKDLPLLKQVMGKARFDQQIDFFLKNFVSRQANLSRLSRLFACSFSEEDYLKMDVAGVELIVDEVLDAPAANALTMQGLQELAGKNLAEHIFHFTFATKLLTLRSNAAELWVSMQRGECLPALISQQEQTWLIWRREPAIPGLLLTDKLEARLLRSIQEGQNFTALCALVAEHSTDREAVQAVVGYLRSWVELGILAA